jgi:peroxiredoxin
MGNKTLLTKLIYGGIAALALLGALIIGVAAGTAGAGTTAPDFKGRTTAGETITLSDHRGSIVVLNIWATWCGPCVAKIPEVNRVAETYADKGVVVIGISGDHDRHALERFEAERGLAFPTIYDNAVPIMRLYEIKYFPTILVLDREGKIRARGSGVNIEAEIRKLL